MGAQVNVKSVQTLVRFRTALGQFCHETQQTLETVSFQIRRFEEWLAERQQYWRNQIGSCQEEVLHAQRVLNDCYADEDADCRYCEENLSRAYEALREAEEEFYNVQHWRNQIEDASAAYQRQARRLNQHLQQNIKKAGTFLGRKVASLEAYSKESAVSGGGFSTSLASSSTIVSPAQAASGRVNSVLNSIKTASLLDDLTNISLHRIDGLAKRAPQRVFGNVEEELAAHLLCEKFGFQEIAFDQPYQGIDRIFLAPGIPLIIVESKVNQHGELRLGQTAHGEQVFPEWIRSHVEKMVDPKSASWSPAHEKIAQLIQEQGAEKIPVIAMVTNTETGEVSLYYRAAGTEAWQQWQGSKKSLQDALRFGIGQNQTNKQADLKIEQVAVGSFIGKINFNESHVNSREDFRKVSYETMADGFQKLSAVVSPAVEKGANGDYFSQLDTEQNLTYEQGYRRVYDAFYGDDSIRIEKLGEHYSVINGHHRLFVAKELGIDTVPAQIIERNSPK